MLKLLKGRQLIAYKLRRPDARGKRYVDFYCADEKLTVELDDSMQFDEAGGREIRGRDEFFRALGVKIMRRSDKEYLLMPGDMLKDILSYVKRN